MALFQGRLFCGTLPLRQGSWAEVGDSVSYDHELKSGWRHLAAIRETAASSFSWTASPSPVHALQPD